MENYNLPSTPISCSTNNSKQLEITPLSRKPFIQLDNVKNFQPSTSIQKNRKFGRQLQNLRDNLKPTQISPRKISSSYSSSATPISGSTPNSVHGSGSSVNSNQSPVESSESHPHESLTAAHSSNLLTPIGNSFRRSEAQESSPSKSTPKTFVPYNPFDQLPEVLHLPTVSPSLFKEVVSPSEKEDTDFSWAIDNLALLRPAQFDSPVQNEEIPVDPEYEKKAQEAIDEFFSNVVVPSPWPSSSTRSINLMSALFSSSSTGKVTHISASPALESQVLHYEPRSEGPSKYASAEDNTCSRTVSVWCQTELSLPPILPKEVEAVLAPYFNFTQEQMHNYEENDESSVFNNTTLRRKLLFSEEASSLPQSSDSTSPVTPEGSSNNNINKKRPMDLSSPASKGPLPLDEDDAHQLPWGVSMIRPSSRISGAHSPSSSSFIHSCAGKSFVDSPSPLRKRFDERSSISSLNDVSPISYVPPNGVRSLPSPSSEHQQTPSRRKFLSSPKLSPILNKSYEGHHPRASLSSIMAVQLLNYDAVESKSEVQDDGDSFSNSTMQNSTMNSNGQFSFENVPLKTSVMCSRSESQGFVVTEEKVGTEGSTMQAMKEACGRIVSKSSPQFSSSPIKRNGSSNSSCRLDFLNLDAGESSPQKFAESPPVSPIAWSCDTRGSHHLAVASSDPPLRKISPDDQLQSIESIDEVEGERTTKPATEFSKTHENVVCNSTRMDTDSPIFFEGSTIEEISSGQDTGYQTGSSLQATNQSNFLTSASTSLSKDAAKSPLPRSRTSPLKPSFRFNFSREFVRRQIVVDKTREEVVGGGRVSPH